MIRVRPPTPALAFDLARWMLERSLRESLPPEDPEVARFFSGLGWRWLRWAKQLRARMMLDEVRRTFRVSARTAEGVVREAHDISLQVALEGLILARISASELDRYVHLSGEVTPGTLLLCPSLAGVPMLISALAHRHPGVVVYRPRGLPPPEVHGVGPLRVSAINRRRAAARLAEEDQLPVAWVDDASQLESLLQAGKVVVAAADGRTWSSYRRAQVFGRDALLGTTPWELAARWPVSATFVHREKDKSWAAEVQKPRTLTRDVWVHELAEPWLEEHPGDWAMWLAQCRMQAATDDHPLFCDYAPDERWRRWA